MIRFSEVSKYFAPSFGRQRNHIGKHAVLALFGVAPKVDHDKIASSLKPALNRVSFQVEAGEALGIIGLNGAGKTTTLRLAGGGLQPDAGKITVKGRTEQIIDLTAGWDSNRTGLENLVFNTRMRGWTKAEREACLQSIIEFSELGEALDSPVAFYSQGMRLKLAFSIAIHATAENLLIDEVMAVGDFAFQQKCFRKMEEFRAQKAVLFASHSMGALKRTCTKLLVLNAGSPVLFNDVGEGIDFYEASASEAIDESRYGGQFLEQEFIRSASLDVVDVTPAKRTKKRDPFVNAVRLKANIELAREIDQANISFLIFDLNGRQICSLNSQSDDCFLSGQGGDVREVSVSADLPGLAAGAYRIVLVIVKGGSILYRRVAGSFDIPAAKGGAWGVFQQSSCWEIQSSA